MAEAALVSIASKVLSTIASPAFKKAYEKARSIFGARIELEELKETIKAVQAKLLDAEKQQKESATVKNWIERVRDVLYDAEDLFDVVATDDMLRQQTKGNKKLKEVQVFFSKLNPIASSDFISKKVKAIRKILHKISVDMALFKFVDCNEDEKRTSGMRRGVETGHFVDIKDVIGRDKEKQQVLNFLYDELYLGRNISLISIVGIGGMGKSALAQLVYNDDKIQSNFNRKYWACISDIFDEKEVIERIYQSMNHAGQYKGLSLDQLQINIRQFVNSAGKFLLVLDDLWDEDKAMGSKLWSLLSSDNAKGSMIIITTRQSSVAKAMKADKILELNGLSSDASWDLFRRFAFTEEQENDPAWISLGQRIEKKCVNVPLAIKSIACLLSSKNTMGEWKTLEDTELSKIQLSGDRIMSTLRLSYDHLPSHLKNCFAYCCLFPKDYELLDQTLIYLWIAQGYVKPRNDETLEMAGQAYLMELFRGSFFQCSKNEDGSVRYGRYKMHDLLHDLAQNVAGEESSILSSEKNKPQKKIRHVAVGYEIGESHSNPLSLLESGRLRSLLSGHRFSCTTRVFNEQVKKFKFLRTLYLASCIEDVPGSVGELKYLRYLNLSGNGFTHLPDSITKLVNLITLDISGCRNLVELPRDIGKLINLRHLQNYDCENLNQMPLSFGALTSLQELPIFRVSKSDGAGEKCCGVDGLYRLDLQGKLMISYKDDGGWSTDDVMLEWGHISNDVETLQIWDYPGLRIPTWWREDLDSRLPKLECLILHHCEHLKHLAPLRILPCLRALSIRRLNELEYVEDEEIVSTTPFFPSLQQFELCSMGKLKGWSRHLNEDRPILFPLLAMLNVESCSLLESMPPAPHLTSLRLENSSSTLIEQLLSTCPLQHIIIENCLLTSFPDVCFTSLRTLGINGCPSLRKINLAPNVLEELSVYSSRDVKLLDHDCLEDCTSVNCLSLANLRFLFVDGFPRPEDLPECLRRLKTLGTLHVQMS